MTLKTKMPVEQVYRILKIEDGQEKDNEYYDFLVNFANLVKTYRKENHLSNKEFADKVGVTTTLVSRVESGNKNLGIKTIIKFLSYMDKKININ